MNSDKPMTATEALALEKAWEESLRKGAGFDEAHERAALAELVGLWDERGDIEMQHAAADEVLCTLLRALGYGRVVDAWDKVPKWYA